ncbi:MAG: phosphatase PAP2 family protein [Candidatus Binataceae bacterium]
MALVVLFFTTSAASAQVSIPKLTDEVTSDFKYIVNNTAMDAEDVATAPLHIASPDSPIFSPKFYLVLAGAGALWGGSYALDQTMRSQLRSMSSSDASLLQDVSYASVSASTALLYGWGLYTNDSRAREDAITAGMGAGIASLLDLGIKPAFGRLRPYQSSSHTAFFAGGQSFVSGDVTPMFALAAGVSDYFDNQWYVAVPVFSLALLDGFGRMGFDAHWFSDVVGAALLGAGTTELLLWMHRRHAVETNRWRVFTATSPTGTLASGMPTGLGVSYSW